MFNCHHLPHAILLDEIANINIIKFESYGLAKIHYHFDYMCLRFKHIEVFQMQSSYNFLHKEYSVLVRTRQDVSLIFKHKPMV